MERFSYLKSVAAVLFAAVCAYLAAWLFPFLPGCAETLPVTAAAGTVIELEGIALRRELALDPPPRALMLPEENKRIPAGALVYAAGDDIFSGAESAIFVSGCDGLEYLVPPEDETLSAAQLSEYLAARPADRPGKARLIRGFYWYYAAFLPPGEAPPEKGSRYLRFEGFEEYTKALLVSAEQSPEGTALLFRLSLGDGAFFDLRKCKAELLLSGFGI